MADDCCVLKFPQSSVEEKYLMDFKSENAVSNFSGVVTVNRAWETNTF